MFFMFTIANQSIINIRSDTDLQNAKNLRKFEYRGHGQRIHLNTNFGVFTSLPIFVWQNGNKIRVKASDVLQIYEYASKILREYFDISCMGKRVPRLDQRHLSNFPLYKI